MIIKSENPAYFTLCECNGSIIGIIEKPEGDFDIKPKVTQALKEHFDAEVKEIKNFEFSDKNYIYSFDAVIEEDDDDQDELFGFELIPCAVY